MMCPYSTYCGLDGQRIPRSLVNKKQSIAFKTNKNVANSMLHNNGFFHKAVFAFKGSGLNFNDDIF